jgi:hypothetical protein
VIFCRTVNGKLAEIKANFHYLKYGTASVTFAFLHFTAGIIGVRASNPVRFPAQREEMAIDKTIYSFFETRMRVRVRCPGEPSIARCGSVCGEDAHVPQSGMQSVPSALRRGGFCSR